MLDLQLMRWIRTDIAAGEATIGGGALMSDLLRELPPEWVTVTGTIGSVGMAGICGAGWRLGPAE